MAVQRYQRRELPPPFSGTKGPENIGALTQHYGAMANTGQAIASTALKFSDAYLARKNLTDQTKATTDMYEAFANLEEELAKRPDYQNIEGEYNQASKAILQGISQNQKWTPETKTKIEGHFASLRTHYGTRMANIIETKGRDAGRAEAIREIDGLLKAGVDTPDETIKQAKKLLAKHVEAQDFDQEEAAKMEVSLPGQLETNYVLREAGAGRYENAYKTIDAAHLEEPDKLTLRRTVESMHANALKANEAQLELVREQDRDAINKAKFEGRLADLPALIEGSNLEEKEQGQELQWVTNENRRIEKGEGIVTNVQTEYSLMSLADGIALNTYSVKQVEDALSESRYGKNPSIDDIAYRRVASAILEKASASRSNALTIASRNAIEQIARSHVPDTLATGTLDLASIMASLAKGVTPEDQRRWWWASQYMNDMRNWFTENPKLTGKEFYQYSQAKLFEYKNAGDEEILRQQKTKEEALRLPSKFGPLWDIYDKSDRPTQTKILDALRLGASQDDVLGALKYDAKAKK